MVASLTDEKFYDWQSPPLNRPALEDLFIPQVYLNIYHVPCMALKVIFNVEESPASSCSTVDPTAINGKALSLSSVSQIKIMGGEW